MASMLQELAAYSQAEPWVKMALEFVELYDRAKMMETAVIHGGEYDGEQVYDDDEIAKAWEDVDAAYERWCLR